MSHYVATVILGKDIDPLDDTAVRAAVEKQMAPYDEDKSVPHRERVNREDLARFVGHYSSAESQLDIMRRGADKAPVVVIPPGSPLSAYLPLWEQWNGEPAVGIVEDTDEEGPFETIEVASTRNPAGLWDWYEIGGRWRGYFQLKAGRDGLVGQMGVPEAVARQNGETPPIPTGADVCRVGDIDWVETARDAYNDALRAYDEAEDKYPLDGRTRRLIWGIEPCESREDYAQRVSSKSFATYAVIDGEILTRGRYDPDVKVEGHDYRGAWVEEPLDEWEAQWDRLIQSLDPETVIAIVDYHS